MLFQLVPVNWVDHTALAPKNAAMAAALLQMLAVRVYPVAIPAAHRALAVVEDVAVVDAVMEGAPAGVMMMMQWCQVTHTL